jgi:hypothetical protein
MKRVALMAGLLFVSIVAFRITERLSTDAIGMGLGLLFGLVAGIPTALLVLAAVRRREDPVDGVRGSARQQQFGYGGPYPGLPQQPPVIILTGNGLPMQAHGAPGYGQAQGGGYPLLPGPTVQPQARNFRVFGGDDDTADDLIE